MTKNEQLRNLIAKDLFGVANMAAHYDIELPEEVEDFMMDWFDNDPHQPTEYTYEELQDLAIIVLDIVDKNPQITREPMVKFPLSELKKMIGKTEFEMSLEKASQMELWSDMNNINSLGLSGFLKKHGTNQELLEAQAVIKAFFG